MRVATTITGLPELLRELKRLSEAVQERVVRNMSTARVVARRGPGRRGPLWVTLSAMVPTAVGDGADLPWRAPIGWS
jgi:hypothetical protein